MLYTSQLPTMPHTAQSIYTPPDLMDSEDPVTHHLRPADWRKDYTKSSVSLAKQGSNRYSEAAKQVRDTFCKYYSSKEGEVHWQYDMI